MIQGILGRKLGMTQFFEEGKSTPVTIIEAGPCPVMQIKTEESDGYAALQLGFGEKKVKPAKKRRYRRALKPEIGHAKKADTTPKRFIREIRWDGDGEYELGQEIKVDIFESGAHVDVIGTTKGRGFTGVMKRYNFKGGQATHGQHNRDRHGGSIGQASFPGRTFKGMKMPGRYGVERVTIQNLRIVKIDAEKNLIAIEGAVPGHNGSFLIVRKAVKKA